MDRLKIDFEAWSTRHSWYKHLPMPWKAEAEKFFLVRRRASAFASAASSAPTKPLWDFVTKDSPCLKDLEPEVLAATLDNPIRANAFLRGVEDDDGHSYELRVIRGGWQRMCGPEFYKWLAEQYPDLHEEAVQFCPDPNFTTHKPRMFHFEIARREKQASLCDALVAAECILAAESGYPVAEGGYPAVE